MAEREKIRVVELFAGVGGFRVGLESCAGERFQTVWADQWEPGQRGQWAFQCYRQRFGAEARCVNADISTVVEEVPEHDLLVGGFPCQDYSVASTGAKGIEGKKGVLWWSIHKIIGLRRPDYVLLENVDRLLKSPARQRGRDFGIILKCLQDNGYAVEWRVINAAEYGNIQRRRRTFLFACRKDLPFGRKMAAGMASGPAGWLTGESFFAGAFPIRPELPVERKKVTQTDLNGYEDLVAVTDGFQAAFYNCGMMVDGQIWSAESAPAYDGPFRTLDEAVEHGDVPERYFLSDDKLPKWETMKGAKKVMRTSRTGFQYQFSEGAIAFPDPLDRPARTMLTSEGTPNRSSHVIQDPKTGKLRRLMPEECERINGFPEGWTATEMPERQRYFIMGNALVVPLVERMGRRLLEIRDGQ